MENDALENVQEVAGEATQPQEGDKKFTQADVDRIIQKRLSEWKRRAEKESAGQPSGTAAEEPQADAAAEDQSEETTLAERAVELDRRAARLECWEYLMKSNYPTELLDILDTSDKSKFIQKADKVIQLANQRRPKTAVPLRDPEPVASLKGRLDDLRHTPKHKFYGEEF